MKILAIETSCDETGVCVIEAEGGMENPRFHVLANITASQIALHAQYGGVFPMMAKREHARNLVPLLKEVLKNSNLLQTKTQNKNNHSQILKNLRMIMEKEPELFEQFAELISLIEKPDINAIAVTSGPGLEPALWVGINFAKALSIAWNIPVIPINHMEGHIFAAFISDNNFQFPISNFKFPVLTLLISGGHTELVLMKDWFDYEMIGKTRDDAVGEAFDKVARILGLPYPGGPEISKLAKSGTAKIEYRLPRPMIHSNDYDFSFSGLKTAVLYMVKKLPKLSDEIRADIALEFEEAVTEVLVEKTLRAVDESGAMTLILGGGVAANDRIREVMKNSIAETHPECNLYLPPVQHTTDNALMIAVA